MTRDKESAESALADRLINYSDALVAVAFLSMSGLGVVVADPDIRCSISSAVAEIIVANLVSTLLIVGVILTLRRWEMDLRSGRPQEGKVARYSRLLHIARLVVVWASLALSITLAMTAGGEECENGPRSLATDSLRRAVVLQFAGDAAGELPSILPGRAPVG